MKHLRIPSFGLGGGAKSIKLPWIQIAEEQELPAR